MSIKIYPILAGEMFLPRAALYESADSTPVQVPILAFYIKGANKKILVDTGACAPDSDRIQLHPFSYTRTADQRIDIALKKATGVDAKDIDIVLLSHLHWDHSEGMDYFEKAEFWVQMDEVIDSINPSPKYVKTYEAFSGGYQPCWATKARKWHFVEGTEDVEVIPRVKFISLPGHSIGLRGVQVDTGNGICLLPSDSVMRADQLHEETKTITPCPTCYLPEEAKKSVARLEKLGYTQSELTYTMNKLEEELGVKLIVRMHHGVRPTPEGEALLPSALLSFYISFFHSPHSL